MRTYLTKEALHTAFAVAMTVVVAVAADLMGIQSFKDVSLAGLGVTALRSFATAIVSLGSRYVASGGS